MAERDDNLDEVSNPDLGVDEDSGMSGSSSDRGDSDLGSSSDSSTSGEESGYGDSGSSGSSEIGEDNTSNR